MPEEEEVLQPDLFSGEFIWPNRLYQNNMKPYCTLFSLISILKTDLFLLLRLLLYNMC